MHNGKYQCHKAASCTYHPSAIIFQPANKSHTKTPNSLRKNLKEKKSQENGPLAGKWRDRKKKRTRQRRERHREREREREDIKRKPNDSPEIPDRGCSWDSTDVRWWRGGGGGRTSLRQPRPPFVAYFFTNVVNINSGVFVRVCEYRDTNVVHKTPFLSCSLPVPNKPYGLCGRLAPCLLTYLPASRPGVRSAVASTDSRWPDSLCGNWHDVHNYYSITRSN